MMRNMLLRLVLSAVALGLFSAIAMAQAEVARMTKEDLKVRLSDPNTRVVDVRTAGDWSSSELKIKDAVRLEVRDVAAKMADFDKGQTLVFYCA